jgi:hypothetical protein
MNWRDSSIIISIVWRLRYLPLFFIVAAVQSSMPIPSRINGRYLVRDDRFVVDPNWSTP